MSELWWWMEEGGEGTRVGDDGRETVSLGALKGGQGKEDWGGIYCAVKSWRDWCVDGAAWFGGQESITLGLG